MKTKLAFSPFFCLLLFSITSLAQEKRSIEITVSDTVMLRPEMIKYQISSGDPSYPYDVTTAQSANDAAAVAALENVCLSLKKEKFTFAMNTGDNYTLNKSIQNKPSVVVTMRSKAELEKLIKLLAPFNGISGKISSVDFESPVPYHEIMFKRLYDKAATEAGIFAKLAETSVEKFVSATEVNDQYGGYMDWLMELSKTASQYDMLGLNAGLDRVYTRKFSFKFEIK
jgi:hypothetical protein